MNHKQMQQRCPGCKFIKRVLLQDYKFIYDGYSAIRKGAVANIIENRGGIVWGSIFEISEEHLKALDSFEGYPEYYDKKIIQVKDENSNSYDAWVYFRNGQKQGQPSEEYHKVVIQGAKDCNLPKEYIKNNLLKKRAAANTL